nr:amino acid ABC transporter permease [Arthrobacter pigmenti]
MYAVFIIVVAVVVLTTDWVVIQNNFFNLEVAAETFPEIVTIAAKNTVLYTAIAFVGGMILGLVFALMKLSPVLPYRWFATAYIELFRGLPALLVIFGFAYGLPIATGWQPPGGSTGAGLIALMIVSSAYIAETLRAGIEAVPKGQVEAARSLGMRPSWTMVSVVLPQAFRIVTPPLTNELVILIKDTSLLFIVGMALGERELTTFARDALTTQANSTPLVLAALLYLVITLPLTQLVAKLERHNKRGR